MGCDIHTFVERKINGEWESVDKWADDELPNTYIPRDDRFYTNRDYVLFGMICRNVRTLFENGLPPKGIPDDLTTEVTNAFYDWGDDGHSHSYLTPKEIRQLIAMTISDSEFAKVNYEGYYYKLFTAWETKLLSYGGEDQRLVFWFDN